jgi:hypothetical protein
LRLDLSHPPLPRFCLEFRGMGKGGGKGCGKGNGVQDFAPWLRNTSSKASGSLGQFKGKFVAVDVSHALHAALRNQAAATQCHADPPVPITGIHAHLRMLCDIFEKFDVKPIMVFDGIRHPGKSRVDDQRGRDRQKMMSELSALYKKSDHEQSEF